MRGNKMSEMRTGYIQSFNPERRCGTIVSGLDRFWYHADRIVRGPADPEIKSMVIFEVSPKPALPGKLPMAIQIIILEDEIAAGRNALASKTASEVK
jgi:hypothetical protein